MDVSDVERWSRSALEAEARRLGTSNPEGRSRTELIATIRRGHGAPLRRARRAFGKVMGIARTLRDSFAPPGTPKTPPPAATTRTPVRSTPGGKASDKAKPSQNAAPAPENAATIEAALPTTAPPETAAPETAPPETAPPETAAPETAPPETAAPETAAPETAAPETAAPVTAAPVTAAPVTAAPTTAAPVTAAPVTAPPVTAAPVTAAPATAAPETAPAETLPSEAPSPPEKPKGTEPDPLLDSLNADKALRKSLADEPIPTRTMARLLARQGHRRRALGIYRKLLLDDPEDQSLRNEINRLRDKAPGVDGDNEVALVWSDDGLLVAWSVTDASLRRCERVLGGQGVLRLRAVLVLKPGQKDVREHEVPPQGERLLRGVPQGARLTVAVGLAKGDRFVSIAHAAPQTRR